MNPGMCEAPFIFEPTLTFWESKIAGWMSDLTSWQAEDTVEDTHLATARRQWEGNGISGTVKMSRREALFYYLLDLILFYDTGGWKQ